MEKISKYVIELEKHPTKNTHDNSVNGSLTVIWRDWDNLIKQSPKMVYVSSVNPNEIKGPHLHVRRNSFFTCIHGKVVFIIQESPGKYVEIISDAENPVLVIVPKGVSSSHVNLSDSVSHVLALADIAWKPNDNEMVNVTFDDYEFKKWNQNF